MKKIILLAMVVLLGLAVASPLIIGSNVETTFRANVARLDEMPFYTATIDSYDAGYGSAQAVVRLGFDMAAMTADLTPEERVAMQPYLDAIAQGFALNMDVRHGPLLLSGERTFGLFRTRISLPADLDLPEGMARILGNSGNAETVLTMGFGGDGELVITAPAFDFEDATGSLSFGGIDFHADLQNWGYIYDATGNIGESRFTNLDNGSEVTLSPVTLALSGDMSEGIVASTGQFEFDFTGMAVDTDTEMFRLEHMTMNTAITSPTEETLDVVYQFGIESMSGVEMEETLEDLVVNFSLRNMDKAAVRAAADTYMDPGFFAQDPLVIQAAMSAMMTNLYGSAEWYLDQLSFTYGDDVSLNMSGSLTVDPDLFSNPALAQNPFLLMAAIDVTLSLEFSEGLAGLAYEAFLRNQFDPNEIPAQQIEQLIALQRSQLGPMLGQLVQTGTLKLAANGYAVDLSLTDGNLLVNGAPGNLPFF